jgi:hypothetical protein
MENGKWRIVELLLSGFVTPPAKQTCLGQTGGNGL